VLSDATSVDDAHDLALAGVLPQGGHSATLRSDAFDASATARDNGARESFEFGDFFTEDPRQRAARLHALERKRAAETQEQRRQARGCTLSCFVLFIT
jgi:hypothetical protein